MRGFCATGLATTLLLVQCAKTTYVSDVDGAVGEAVATQISSINSATGDINAGSATALSLRAPANADFSLRKDFWEKLDTLLGRFFDSSLSAISYGCSAGSLSDSGAFGASSATIITRTWSSCTGDGGWYRRNGTIYLSWSGLTTSATPYIQIGSVLKRATQGLTVTRTSSGNLVQIKGNDTANMVNGSPTNQVFTWTSVSGNSRQFTLHIDEIRTGLDASNLLRFTHIVTTPTDLVILVDAGSVKPTRTIISGSVNVYDSLSDFNVTTTFTNAVWDVASCKGISGGAAVTVTGSKTGSGSLQFNDGTVNLTYGNGNEGQNLPGC